MKKIFIALLFFTQVNAENRIGLDTLMSHFNIELTVQSYRHEKFIKLEFCPTTSCELVIAEGNDIASFLEFMDTYILYFSGYGDLSKYIHNKSPTVPPIEYIEFRLRSMGNKIEINQEELVKKTRLLIEKFKITKLGVNYDEGARVVFPNSDWEEKEINKDIIKRNFEWYKEAGVIDNFNLK